MSAHAPRRIVVMGVSGSGKSTVARALAQRLALPFVEGDELHPPANVTAMRAGRPLTDEDRRGWLQAVARALAEAEAQGAVVSCSALKRSYRDQLRASAPDLHLVHLTGPHRLLAERMQGRAGHYMPASLLHSQLDTLQPPGADEAALTYSITLPADAIVDALCHQLEGSSA